MDNSPATPPEPHPEDRRTIAEVAQRYVNARVFREMSRVIQAWREEDKSRQRAARLLRMLIVVSLVAATACVGWLAYLR
jgi:hypothetical protein